AREQDLDSEERASVLARRFRRAEGIDRARAFERHARLAGPARHSERVLGRTRRALGDGRRFPLGARGRERARAAHGRAYRSRAPDARGNLPGGTSMKAVARLFALYFWGTTSARICTSAGAALVVGGCAFNTLVQRDALGYYE